MAVSVLLALPSAAQQPDGPQPIGVNLWHIYDFSSQFMFVDAMKTSRGSTAQAQRRRGR